MNIQKRKGNILVISVVAFFVIASFLMLVYFYVINPEKEKSVSQNVNTNYSAKDGRTPLMTAASLGKKDEVISLLNSGVKIGDIDAQGNTALLFASAKGQVEVVKILLDRGANVNEYNKLNNTPLYEAAAWNHADVADVLLKAGADINGKDNRPPLYIAVLNGSTDSVKLLLERGADPNIKFINPNITPKTGGLSPLEGARLTNNKEIEKLLIAAGAKE